MTKRKFMPLHLAACAALALCPGPCARAEMQDWTEPDSDVTVVTASRLDENLSDTAADTAVLTREEIERSNARSLADLLRMLPGVSVAQQGGTGAVTSVFVRGSNSNQTLVLLDGEPLNETSSGRFEFAHVALDRIERVEVVRGPVSSVHGSNAGGGVVHIITRKGDAKETGAEGRMNFMGGSRSAFSGLAEWEGRRKKFWWSAAASLDATDNDFPHNAYRRRNLSGSLGAALPGGSTLTLSAQRLSAAFEQGPMYSSFSGGERLDENAETVDRGGLYAFRWSAAPPRFARWRHELSLSFRNLNRPYRDPMDSDQFCAIFARSRARALRLNLAEHFAWSEKSRSVFGAEFIHERGSGESVADCGVFGVYPSSFDSKLRARAFFFEQGFDFGDLHATLGGHYDAYRSRSDAGAAGLDHAFTWRAAAARRFPGLAGGGKLRAVAATSFRRPSMDELYYPFYGVPTLRPERGFSAELGWDQSFRGGRTKLSVTVFRNRYRDLIETNFALSAPENVPRARMQGVEFSWRQDWRRGLYSELGWEYLDARNLDTDKPLVRRPHHQSASLRLGWAGKRLDFALDVRRAGSRPDLVLSFPGTVYRDLHPYTMADFYGGWKMGDGFSLRFRAENLFGEDYEDTGAYPQTLRPGFEAADAAGYPLPRRRFALGLDFRW
jgi:vitamin B12 transporter